MLCSSTSSLLLYVTISVMSFFLTLHSTLFHSDNYFSGTIIYFTDPLTNMILYNFVTALTVFTYRCLLLLYFDDIR